MLHFQRISSLPLAWLIISLFAFLQLVPFVPSVKLFSVHAVLFISGFGAHFPKCTFTPEVQLSFGGHCIFVFIVTCTKKLKGEKAHRGNRRSERT